MGWEEPNVPLSDPNAQRGSPNPPLGTLGCTDTTLHNALGRIGSRCGRWGGSVRVTEKPHPSPPPVPFSPGCGVE